MSNFELGPTQQSIDYFQVGCRIRDLEGFRATVRYIGFVAAAKNKTEKWLGVEWDDYGRGKHDGSCVDESGNLHKYFNCPQGSGSFIKPTKVQRGKTFFEALSERYVAMNAPEIVGGDSTLPGAFVSTAKGNAKAIEFVGEKKLRKWQQLSTITTAAVRNDSITVIDTNVAEFGSHLVEIDLQDNLLWQWSEIFSLVEQVPALQNLLLQGNKFEALTDQVLLAIPVPRLQSMSNLRLLALNSCGINGWVTLQRLEPFLGSLCELYVAHSIFPDLPRAHAEALYEAATGIASTPLPSPVRGFPSLRVLDLSNCGLDDWSQVLALHTLQSLQDLILDSNPIPSVGRVPDGHFPLLQRISISGTLLESWEDVNAIASYPGLRQLRLSHIPLFVGKGASEVRPLVIARISQLLHFNGSLIGPRERRDAEKCYLRAILRQIGEHSAAASASVLTRGVPAGGVGAMGAAGAAEAEGSGDPVAAAALTALMSTHPRYAELQEIHGADMVQAGRQTGGGNIAGDLIAVTFKNMSFSSGGRNEPLEKKLPGSLSISRLQLLVKQLFGLDPHLQQLSLRVYKDSPPTLLDDMQATLSYFGAIDGCEIFINEAKG